MAEILAYALPYAAFLAIYALLRLRARRRSGVTPPIQWGLLAAVTACALAAALTGLVLDG